tara:strand:+ start:310 stop:633 length:324 start_codon:yes stop_codon:yes gene_type:complete
MPKTLLTDFFRPAPASSVTATPKKSATIALKTAEREEDITTKIIGLSDSDSDSDDDAKANSADDSASDSDDNSEVSDPEDVVPLKELKRRALADMRRKREELKRKRV